MFLPKMVSPIFHLYCNMWQWAEPLFPLPFLTGSIPEVRKLVTMVTVTLIGCFPGGSAHFQTLCPQIVQSNKF